MSDYSRLEELLNRMNTAREKAGGVSNSECHEIQEYGLEAIEEIQSLQSKCEALEAERDFLRERVNSLCVDAERYRFIRDDENLITGDDSAGAWEMLGELTLGEFDSFIDEKMQSIMYEPTDH